MLKKLSCRWRDPRHLSEVVQLIKTLRKQVAFRESERAERATFVSQEKLQVAGAKVKPVRFYCGKQETLVRFYSVVQDVAQTIGG